MRTGKQLLVVIFVHLILRFSLAADDAQSPASEDPQLRARAVGLLERAAQLSSPVWPMNEQVITFHVQNPEPGAASEGSLKIGVGRTDLKRWDYVYGAYHLSQVENGMEYATLKTGPEPADLIAVRKMLPAMVLHFDQSDLIRAITDKSVDGTPASCVDFETITGTRHQTGTVCIDQAAGYLIYSKIDDVVIKQSKFYAFSNGFLPGHLERWTAGTKLFDIDTKIVVHYGDFAPDYFDYPEGATISHACNSFTPAYADNTPQPPIKSYSDTGIDIVVHGFVDPSGHPINLKVLDATHRDLADEALRLVSTWTFRPAQCNYQPASQQRDFIVHFQGWQ
jgi:hypothetical protein